MSEDNFGDSDIEGARKWYKDQQEKFLEDFKKELIARIVPIVNTVIVRLRDMERNELGSGKQELIAMFKAGDINEAMFKVVRPALDNIDEPYKIDLSSIQPIKSTKLG